VHAMLLDVRQSPEIDLNVVPELLEVPQAAINQVGPSDFGPAERLGPSGGRLLCLSRFSTDSVQGAGALFGQSGWPRPCL
jgi:hypothetical protein